MRMTLSKAVDWDILKQYAQVMNPEDLAILVKEIGESFSPQKARNFLAHLHDDKKPSSKH